MVSLPLGDIESNAVFTFYVRRPEFERLVVIMSQAFDPEEMAKSVGTYLLGKMATAVYDAVGQIVDELPLGQFSGWNAPERGGSDGSTPSAA